MLMCIWNFSFWLVLFIFQHHKDTRNQTVHNINICEVNAYPKLFLNGYRFIKEYVDKDIEVEPWKEECEEFDLSLIHISVGLKIASYGNIIYLTTVLKEYLFSGKIDSSENQDIYSVIDMLSLIHIQMCIRDSNILIHPISPPPINSEK